ncbi:MAG: tetratricopeptide repeat protein [Burkholderiales bacterium]|nr:tetratricopeptide repeat protein [Burkholderiales bacterium]
MKLNTGCFCLCLILASATWAQTASDAELCLSITGNPDLAIKHCTAAIESKKITGEDLAQLYSGRAAEWAAKGDYDRAIADAGTALKLAPKLAFAHYQRGVAWANKGEVERAIADFDAALQLRPNDPAVLYSRAVEYTVKGEYARALADFDAVLRIDPKAEDVQFARGRTLFYMSEHERGMKDMETAFKAQPNLYVALWLYLARKRSGVANAEELLDRETRGLGGGVPGAAAALYGGRTDLESVAAAAKDPDPVRQREYRCEADFYIAHWHLIRDERPRALPLLQEVQRTCPKNILEYEGAVAELRRLK